MSVRYAGPRWPLSPILTDALYPELFSGYQQLQDNLRVEFGRKAKAIAEDADLSPQGRQKKLRELSETFRTDKRVKAFADTLGKAKAREAEIRRTLTKRTPPKPKGSDPAEVAAQLIERAFARHRTLERFSSLSPEARGRVVWRALDAAGAGDVAAAEFLSDLRGEARVPGEAGLLDDNMVARVDAALMKNTNPDLVRELEQLAGKLQVDGKHDRLTSITQCAEETLRIFHEDLDASIGVTPEGRAIATAVDAADKGDAIEISSEAGRDHQLWKAAAARAQEKNIPLRIVGDKGEAEIQPGELAPANANGAVGGMAE